MMFSVILLEIHNYFGKDSAISEADSCIPLLLVFAERAGFNL